MYLSLSLSLYLSLYLSLSLCFCWSGHVLEWPPSILQCFGLVWKAERLWIQHNHITEWVCCQGLELLWQLKKIAIDPWDDKDFDGDTFNNCGEECLEVCSQSRPFILKVHLLTPMIHISRHPFWGYLFGGRRSLIIMISLMKMTMLRIWWSLMAK